MFCNFQFSTVGLCRHSNQIHASLEPWIKTKFYITGDNKGAFVCDLEQGQRATLTNGVNNIIEYCYNLQQTVLLQLTYQRYSFFNMIITTQVDDLEDQQIYKDDELLWQTTITQPLANSTEPMANQTFFLLHH